MTSPRRIEYELTYNPILEYWDWMNASPKNRRRISTKVFKVYKDQKVTKVLLVMTDQVSITQNTQVSKRMHLGCT